MMRYASRIINILVRITGITAAASILFAAIIITEGVIVRKVFNISTTWQIEGASILLVYSCFLGSAFVQMNKQHLNVDFFIDSLSLRYKKLTHIVTSIISCIVSGVIAWYSWPMWWTAIIKNEHSASLWGPPLWIPYLALPLGMSLLFLQYLLDTIKTVSSLKDRSTYTRAI